MINKVISVMKVLDIKISPIICQIYFESFNTINDIKDESNDHKLQISREYIIEKYNIKKTIDDKAKVALKKEYEKYLGNTDSYIKILRSKFRRRTFKDYNNSRNWMIEDVVTIQISNKPKEESKEIDKIQSNPEEVIQNSKIEKEGVFSKNCKNCKMANPASEQMPESLVQCFFCGYQMNSILNVTIGLELDLDDEIAEFDKSFITEEKQLIVTKDLRTLVDKLYKG